MAKAFAVTPRPQTFQAIQFSARNYDELVAFVEAAGGHAYRDGDTLYVDTEVGPLLVPDKGYAVQVGRVVYPMTAEEFAAAYLRATPAPVG